MTSLVTGGTGFIGAEVVRLLLDKGEEPADFIRNPANNRKLADVANQVQFLSGDLSNFSHVLNAVKQA